MLICGASFAGLAVARELAGAGADVLIVDRYEIGERATSACAAPTPWLHAMGVERAIRQEIPCMAFHTPHGSARFRLPWSWSSFDYRELCHALCEQTDARFEIAKVERRDGRHGPHRPRRAHERRSSSTRSAGAACSARAPTCSRRRRRSRAGSRSTRTASGTDLDVWIDRSLVRYGYAWSVPGRRRAAHRRRLLRAAPPRQGADAGDRRAAATRDAVRYQGNWFPHRLRPATEDGVFFAGDSAGHCLPLSGEGIRTAFYFGIAAGREIRAVLDGDSRGRRSRYGAFSRRHAPAFAYALALQRRSRACRRGRSRAAGVMGRERPCRRAFDWYLAIAPPPTSRAAGRLAGPANCGR